MNTFKGLDGVRSCFEGLFKTLHDCSDLAAPIIHVDESEKWSSLKTFGQVFLVWNCPASSYHRATDTFIFNSKGKITRQNVVLHYAPASDPSPEEAAHTLVAQALAKALEANAVDKNKSPEEIAHTLVAQALTTALEDQGERDKDRGWAGKDLDKGW